MRKMWVLVTGLLCIDAHGARGQGFEQQALEISKMASVMTQQTRQLLTASGAPGCGKGCEPAGALNPGDGLDERVVGIAAKFISVKAGEFEMGSPPSEEGRRDDELQHRVTLTKPFEMQATEVTQLQYFVVTGLNPSVYNEEVDCDKDNFKPEYGAGLCANHPVDSVSWENALKFIGELNRIQSTHTYRLPTEAEWEYAARAGSNDSQRFCEGWFEGISDGRTHAVASKKANRYGLYDMFGNVFEWTQDWYGDYPKTPVADPTGPITGSYRVIRGGSSESYAINLRAAFRNRSHPRGGYPYIGLRLVRSSR